MASSEETGTIIVNYKECRRNYAISIGGHAVDGCREFAPAGEQGTEQAFLCQACGCHRSFHRKEVIKNGVVHRAPPLAPPAFVPPVAQGYPLVPYVVVHPVDYGYPLPDQELSGESHHDDHHHHHHHPQQNDHQRGSAMDGLDQRSEMKPNGIKKPKMEPL